MTYTRVCPRDLFNEAKLLKCLGRLSLMILDGYSPLKEIHDTELHDGFCIVQDEADGSIFCENLHFYANGRKLHLFTSLNSKEDYPLMLRGEDEDVDVFDLTGKYFTDEFLHEVTK